MSQLSPEELAAYDEQTRRLIDDAEQEVSESESRSDTAKKEAKEAKEQLESDETRLRKLIRERRENRGKPPQKSLLDHAEPTGKWRQLSVEHLAETLGK